MTNSTPCRTVLILGGSYAGLHAFEILSQELSGGDSVILVERNSHFNHIYSFPRNGILPGLAQSAFIPYPAPQVSSPHRIIQASVTKIDKGYVLLDRLVNLPSSSPPLHSNDGECNASVNDSGYASSADSKPHSLVSARSIENLAESPTTRQTNRIKWDLLIYALGSRLPPPLQLPESSNRTKLAGVDFLTAQQQRIMTARRIVVVGGGPLGIQYATDIAHCYKHKQVTLIHSRTSFLPNFLPEVDTRIKAALSRLGVRTILGERVNVTKLQKDLSQLKELRPVRVESAHDPARSWDADLVLLCTGQVPNTNLMAQFCPSAVPGGPHAGGYICVNRALQVSPSHLGPSPVQTTFGQPISCDCVSSPGISQADERDQIWSRVFAIGDCIDGFGAIKAGHTGWNQAEVAARNVLRILACPAEAEVESADLIKYQKSAPMIRLTVGLDRTICQLPSPEPPYQVEVTETQSEMSSSGAWRNMWIKMGIEEDAIENGWA